MNVTDIPINWTKLKHNRSLLLNGFEELKNGKIISSDIAIFLKSGNWIYNLDEIQEWLGDHIQMKYRIYARIFWYRWSYETKQNLGGIVFEIPDDNDRMHFQLRWYGSE